MRARLSVAFCLIALGCSLHCFAAAAELERLPRIEEPLPESIPPPAEEENLAVPTDDAWRWYVPGSWYHQQFWEGSLELGMNGGAGNSETFSLKTGADLKHESDVVDHSLDVSYARTTANAKTTQDIAIFNGKSDWKFGQSPWNIFGKANVTSDQLRAFDMRLVLNSGVGYRLVDTGTRELVGRFGSGVSREFGGLKDDWVPEAVIGLDAKNELSKRQKLTVSFEYFPDWTDYSDYRLNLKGSWRIQLDEEKKLSLKLEITDQYDSTPDGLNPNQFNYALLLLWKL